jgi:hypothetical protein
LANIKQEKHVLKSEHQDTSPFVGKKKDPDGDQKGQSTNLTLPRYWVGVLTI